jgi:hypothetical protein
MLIKIELIFSLFSPPASPLSEKREVDRLTDNNLNKKPKNLPFLLQFN